MSLGCFLCGTFVVSMNMAIWMSERQELKSMTLQFGAVKDAKECCIDECSPSIDFSAPNDTENELVSETAIVIDGESVSGTGTIKG